MTWCLDWYDLSEEVGRKEYFETEAGVKERRDGIRGENTEYEIYEVVICKGCGNWKRK